MNLKEENVSFSKKILKLDRKMSKFFPSMQQNLKELGKDGTESEDSDAKYFIRDKYYIDPERKIRLDKILLGYELKPLNDSITEQEMEIREKRRAIEEELLNKEDSFDLFAKEHEFNKNIDFYLQFIKVEERNVPGMDLRGTN